MVNGIWTMTLIDGSSLPFYWADESKGNPLDHMPEFSYDALHWNIDAEHDKYPTDADGFIIIPKSDVVRVYFDKNVKLPVATSKAIKFW